MRGALYKAVLLVNELSENDDFLYIGTKKDGEGAPNMEVLASWCQQCAEVYKEMDKADSRFDSATGNAIFLTYGALEDFIFTVLMIQAKSQKKEPPTYHKNSTTHPRFEKFIYLCAQAANVELEADYPDIRNDEIERALKNATNSLRRVRDMDREGWAANWSVETLSSR